jgi:hypothetical protein
VGWRAGSTALSLTSRLSSRASHLRSVRNALSLPRQGLLYRSEIILPQKPKSQSPEKSLGASKWVRTAACIHNSIPSRRKQEADSSRDKPALGMTNSKLNSKKKGTAEAVPFTIFRFLCDRVPPW